MCTRLLSFLFFALSGSALGLLWVYPLQLHCIFFFLLFCCVLYACFHVNSSTSFFCRLPVVGGLFQTRKETLFFLSCTSFFGARFPRDVCSTLLLTTHDKNVQIWRSSPRVSVRSLDRSPRHSRYRSASVRNFPGRYFHCSSVDVCDRSIPNPPHSCSRDQQVASCMLSPCLCRPSSLVLFCGRLASLAVRCFARSWNGLTISRLVSS